MSQSRRTAGRFQSEISILFVLGTHAMQYDFTAHADLLHFPSSYCSLHTGVLPEPRYPTFTASEPRLLVTKEEGANLLVS